VVEKAGRRLGVAALVYAITYTLAYSSGRIAGNWSEYWEDASFPAFPDFVAAGFIAASIALFFHVRSRNVHGERLLNHGLVYEVVAAAGIDVHLAFGMWPEGMIVGGISWVCVWIVFFPMIVPSTSGKATVAALAAASTSPLLYAIGLARGAPPSTPAFWFPS
jgi:hypothetical protein